MREDRLLVDHKPRFAPWLVEPMLRNRATYMKVAVAAALINIFALVSSLFTMTVYDRIVPNEGSSSLIGLSIGLIFVIICLERAAVAEIGINGHKDSEWNG